MDSYLFKCYVCDEQFSSTATYNAHLDSSAHKTRAHTDPSLNNTEFTTENGQVYQCSVCNIYVTGLIPYRQHLEGQKHYKKLKNKKLFDALQSLDASHNTDNKNQKDVSIGAREIAPITIALCDALRDCYMSASEATLEASGPRENVEAKEVSYVLDEKSEVGEQLVGSIELAEKSLVSDEVDNEESSISENAELSTASKLPEEKLFPLKFPHLLQVLEARSLAATLSISNASKDRMAIAFPLECKQCGTKFNGKEPYHQHLASAKHIKKTQAHDLITSSVVDNVYVKPPTAIPGTMMCSTCGITVSGPIPYKQHIESEKHMKQMRLQQFTSDLSLADSSTSGTISVVSSFGQLGVPDTTTEVKLERPRITIISVDEPIIIKRE